MATGPLGGYLQDKKEKEKEKDWGYWDVGISVNVIKSRPNK